MLQNYLSTLPPRSAGLEKHPISSKPHTASPPMAVDLVELVDKRRGKRFPCKLDVTCHKVSSFSVPMNTCAHSNV